MNSEIIEQVLGCSSLPSLPAVAARVLELTSDEDVSLDELAETIQTDQALASKVLRTVNSSYYALRSKVGSIRKAISMLGLGPVKSLTLGFSLVSSLDDTDIASFDFESYWRRGLYSAAAAARFADLVDRDTRDEIFLGALMQDVGMVAMQIALGSQYSDVLSASDGDHRTLIRRELEELEMTHAEVGAMLAERWKLPQTLIMPIRYHEQATAAPQQFNKASKCVALGTLVHDVLTNATDARPLRYLYDKAEKWLGMRNSEVDELVKVVNEEIVELAELFSVDTGERVDAEETLARAAEQLMQIQQDGDLTPTMKFQGVASLLLDERYTNPRTMVLNPRGFEEAMRQSASVANETECEFTLILIGVDQFDRVKFEVGEPGVDRITLGSCTLLRKHFEPFGGLVADLGKGRFAVTLCNVAKEGALRAAEEFRSELERVAASWFVDNANAQIFVSLGAATAGPGDPELLASPTALVTAAAKAMASSQAAGGNCVRVHSVQAA